MDLCDKVGSDKGCTQREGEALRNKGGAKGPHAMMKEEQRGPRTRMKEVAVLRHVKGWSEGRWRWQGGGGVAAGRRWRIGVGEEEVGKVMTLRIANLFEGFI